MFWSSVSHNPLHTCSSARPADPIQHLMCCYFLFVVQLECVESTCWRVQSEHLKASLVLVPVGWTVSFKKKKMFIMNEAKRWRKEASRLLLLLRLFHTSWLRGQVLSDWLGESMRFCANEADLRASWWTLVWNRKLSLCFLFDQTACLRESCDSSAAWWLDEV